MNDKRVIQRMLKAGRALRHWSQEFVRASEQIEQRVRKPQDQQSHLTQVSDNRKRKAKLGKIGKGRG